MTRARILGRSYTTNPIWRWLAKGTGIYGPRKQAYLIPKAGPKLLRFQAGYRRKTHPRIFASGTGGPGGEWVFARRVRHEGIEAGEWPEAAKEKYQPLFKKWADEAMRQGAAASGHGVK